MCERCGRALEGADDARACSYECTFCVECSRAMELRCPNCGGELKTIPTSR
ncbi:MAG: DUF1272 domain-containing protein [Candidatus Eremiobacteraeota bacterium]|nr:DUF1272 domain-containing protein [Candidatus Eremiobacteraeota bacterium]MBV9056020.1 DUF1272 domain-containing protein [Candidatus Eremiobacteraeota bacterium]MBV9699431.1 DUF1272 domain-containing protein [Candidatus Eremiobacteraeota bacterium]